MTKRFNGLLCWFVTAVSRTIDAHTLRKHKRLRLFRHWQNDQSERLKDPRHANSRATNWLLNRKVKAFYNQVTARNLRNGARALLQVRHVWFPIDLGMFWCVLNFLCYSVLALLCSSVLALLWSNVLTLLCSSVLTLLCCSGLALLCCSVLALLCSSVLTLLCSSVLALLCSSVLALLCSSVLTLLCCSVLVSARWNRIFCWWVSNLTGRRHRLSTWRNTSTSFSTYDVSHAWLFSNNVLHVYALVWLYVQLNGNVSVTLWLQWCLQSALRCWNHAVERGAELCVS